LVSGMFLWLRMDAMLMLWTEDTTPESQSVDVLSWMPYHQTAL